MSSFGLTSGCFMWVQAGALAALRFGCLRESDKCKQSFGKWRKSSGIRERETPQPERWVTNYSTRASLCVFVSICWCWLYILYFFFSFSAMPVRFHYITRPQETMSANVFIVWVNNGACGTAKTNRWVCNMQQRRDIIAFTFLVVGRIGLPQRRWYAELQRISIG